MKTTRTLATAAAVPLMALSACGENGGGEDDNSTVTVGVASLPIFAPVFIADERGYFEDRGLDVELETVQTGQDAIPLVSSGQLDVVAAGFSAGVFSGLDAGLEFKIVGSMGVSAGDEFSPAHLIVSSSHIDDGEVADAGDLAGMEIGVAGGEGGTAAYLASLALGEGGLSLEDVELVNVANPDMPAALENGSIDAAIMSAPFSEMALENGSGESVWFPPEGTSGTGLMYGEHFLEEEEAQLFFDALVEASEELQGDARYEQENLEIIAEATGQQVEDLEEIPLYTWLPDLAPQAEQLSSMEIVWIESGALDYESPLNPEDYIDSSYADNASSD